MLRLFQQLDRLPPPLGSFKFNFDATVRTLFSVASAVLSNHSGWIVTACTQRLPPTTVTFGEATAALLGIHIAWSFGYSFIMLEGGTWPLCQLPCTQTDAK